MTHRREEGVAIPIYTPAVAPPGRWFERFERRGRGWFNREPSR
ncbi:MAG: hypothetical protein OJF60_002984 [Burkholderiaceae bacterium]|nr:MAG: hypothetical protein OJF60_002984 [Burkholderiaceae bacterium]